ncbi:MFS transporter [Wolbachia endosymbiont of Anurida maritima]|uniref:MFS transporter n=1 Tax=Wolbachia endosymbiont of Anurida maritima TaxID=2850562 RepID=UPI0035D0EECD
MQNHQIKEVLISSLLCKLAIWYDYMLFIDLINIIGREFFPKANAYQNLLKIFGIFALGAFIKPIGAFIFGYIGDKYGRKISLFISILLISIPSSFITFIPSYESIGILAPILIILIRVVQGIAFGAEQGSSVYLIEHSADKKNLGMFFGIVGLGKSLGILLAAIAIIICKKTTSFNIWGWRIPFAFSFILGLISAFSRYKLKETLAYQTNKSVGNLSSTPISELLKNYKRTLILAILISIPANVIVGFIIFFRALTKEIVLMDTYSTTYINEVALIASSVLIQMAAIIFGILSDKIGREKVAIPCIITSMLMYCPMLFIAYHCKNYLIITLSIIILSVIETGVTPIGIIVSELFPTKVRFSGVSLSRNISSALFGGLTPIVCTWLTMKFTQVNFVAGIYVVFCLSVSLIAMLKVKPQNKKLDW